MGDPYVYPGTNVLKNVAGIINREQLSAYESTITGISLGRLAAMPPMLSGRVSLDDLRAIHRALFHHVYPWAGQLRTVDISKGNSFAPAHKLEELAHPVFKQLNEQKQLKGLTREEFVHKAASLLKQLNNLHPFREGNGRTQREFLRQISIIASHPISWHELGQGPIINASSSLDEQYSEHSGHDEASRNIEASIAAFHGDLGPMRQLLNPLVAGTDEERSQSERFQSTGAERQIGRIQAKYRWHVPAELEKQLGLHHERKSNQAETSDLETQLSDVVGDRAATDSWTAS